jgi:mannose-6-phosphate isomerase-like protein (cupin superfamily)
MNTLVRTLPSATSEAHQHVFELLEEALANVPFHSNTSAVTRFAAKGFPLHLAVHEISPTLAPPAQYTFPHVHEEHDEINIILSRHNLVYDIQVGADEYIIEKNACIWIPRGAEHSANVIKGSGFFITIRLD